MVIQGKARRVFLGLLAALLIGLFVREAVAQMVATPQVCRETTSSDWAWWKNGCWNYPAAPDQPFTGFVVR